MGADETRPASRNTAPASGARGSVTPGPTNTVWHIRSQTAEDVLESSIWKEACARLDARLLKEWTTADPANVEALQAVAYRLGAFAFMVREMKRELKQTSLSG